MVLRSIWRFTPASVTTLFLVFQPIKLHKKAALIDTLLSYQSLPLIAYTHLLTIDSLKPLESSLSVGLVEIFLLDITNHL